MAVSKTSDPPIKDLGLLVFKQNGAVAVLESLGLNVDATGYVRNTEGDIVCSCCEKRLRAQHLGAVLPGSRMYYCDEPACLASYVNKKIDPATAA